MLDREVGALVQEPLALEVTAGVGKIAAGVGKLVARHGELALEAGGAMLDHRRFEAERLAVGGACRRDSNRGRGSAHRRCSGQRELCRNSRRPGPVDRGGRVGRRRRRFLRRWLQRGRFGRRRFGRGRRPLRQPTLGFSTAGMRGGGQMLRLVHRPARPGELPLEVGDVLVEDPEVVPGGACLLAQRLLDLAAPGGLGVDVLLGAPQPALALGDLVPKPVRLRPRPRQLALDLSDLGFELDHRRLRFGGAPAGALGREL